MVDQDDEGGEDYFQIKGEQLRQKEKLVLLFSDQNQKTAGGTLLSDTEAQAVCEFLQKQVKAFYHNRMKRKVLLNLLMNTSEVLEINAAESAVPLG